MTPKGSEMNRQPSAQGRATSILLAATMLSGPACDTKNRTAVRREVPRDRSSEQRNSEQRNSGERNSEEHNSEEQGGRRTRKTLSASQLACLQAAREVANNAVPRPEGCAVNNVAVANRRFIRWPHEFADTVVTSCPGEFPDLAADPIIFRDSMMEIAEQTEATITICQDFEDPKLASKEFEWPVSGEVWPPTHYWTSEPGGGPVQPARFDETRCECGIESDPWTSEERDAIAAAAFSAASEANIMQPNTDTPDAARRWSSIWTARFAAALQVECTPPLRSSSECRFLTDPDVLACIQSRSVERKRLGAERVPIIGYHASTLASRSEGCMQRCRRCP